MFLQLNHQKLDLYIVSKSFVIECYKATKEFPSDERFNLIQQIRRAAISVHLNISEGSSRKSEAERKRYYEIARGSIIEVDAALEISESLGYCRKDSLEHVGLYLTRSFAMLSKLISN
jgi:four helix bundle protein